MNRSPPTTTEPDWALLQVFLAVAEAGSLSAAAGRLQRSQPTLSRQIAALEAQCGVPLFERTRRGVPLTEAGQALRAHAERMREHAQAWSLAAAGRDTALAGTVRLTASEMVSTYLLPPVIAALREAHPEIAIELVASNTVENLIEREADLALRMVRPTQAALVARRLADWPMGVYAHRDYIAAHGRPTRANLLRHRWVGYDRSDQMLRGFRMAGMPVTREFFGFRCDNQVVAWEAVAAGAGIGVGPQRVAERRPELVQVLKDLPVPALPMWLVAHRELRGTPRLKRVFDALAAALGRG